MPALTRALLTLAAALAIACSPQATENDSVGPTPQSAPHEDETKATPADARKQSIESRVPTPPGYHRLAVDPGSFGAWLRDLPVRPVRPPVYLYDGHRKGNQSAHYAVLDVDVSDRNLQQCADAVIRLRAEYLFSGPCSDEIQFNFTSGDTSRWLDWRGGSRPVVTKDLVSWQQTGAVDDGYTNFRAYLESVFSYAGSYSLERELTPVVDAASVEPGDVFIKGGFPGHAVLVVDVAENAQGERIFVMAQSFMPAQDIHILKSFEEISPWYRARADGVLGTPEWVFSYSDLRRFQRTSCEASLDEAPD